MTGDLRGLDDRLLGRRGVAAVAAVVGLLFLAYAVESLRLGAWPLALVLVVLAGLCAQAGVRTWRQRRG